MKSQLLVKGDFWVPWKNYRLTQSLLSHTQGFELGQWLGMARSQLQYFRLLGHYGLHSPLAVLNLEFGISFFVTFSAILRLSHDWPVVTGSGNRNTRRKSPPNPKPHSQLTHMPQVGRGVEMIVPGGPVCMYKSKYPINRFL